MSYDHARLDRMFAALRQEGRGGLGIFVTAGDPDRETGQKILAGLPAAGADMIEFGMPFSDPMADGPSIQAASLRALNAGATLASTLDMLRVFRAGDPDTPVVLMGYYNPIYSYGVDAFLDDAIAAGADGLIVVDLPPEEDAELCLPARAKNLPFVRLATPTTHDGRLPAVLVNTAGFVYYVSITGITGTQTVPRDLAAGAVKRLQKPHRPARRRRFRDQNPRGRRGHRLGRRRGDCRLGGGRTDPRQPGRRGSSDGGYR